MGEIEESVLQKLDKFRESRRETRQQDRCLTISRHGTEMRERERQRLFYNGDIQAGNEGKAGINR